MSLNCLLLTSDATLLELFRTCFSATSVELEMRRDAASAIDLSTRRHLDGFVIDCDDVSGAADVLTEIRGSRSNKASVVVAIVNGTTRFEGEYQSMSWAPRQSPKPNPPSAYISS